jgi:hypothetical protein
MMSWKVGTGLTLLAMESLAILYLLITRSFRRISGPWLIGSGAVGAALGSSLVMHSGGELFPFDPNDDVSLSFFGAGETLLANFVVGVFFPFIFLAVRMLMMRDKSRGAAK